MTRATLFPIVSFVFKRKEKGGEKEDEVSERTPEPEGEVDRWDCNYFTKVVNLMKVITKYYETKLKRSYPLGTSASMQPRTDRSHLGRSVVGLGRGAMEKTKGPLHQAHTQVPGNRLAAAVAS